MTLFPISIKQANDIICEWHRHHKPVPGAKFCIGVRDATGKVHGVVVVGRPVSRMLDTGMVAEVNRCCTDGTPNACSMLYRAAWRAAQAMGYQRIITYTLPEEGGSSLRGAGWRWVGEREGGCWSRESRKRTDDHPTQVKWLWECGGAV